MKKYVLIVVAAFILGALSGCGGTEPKPEAEVMNHWTQDGLKGQVSKAEIKTLSDGKEISGSVAEYFPSGMIQRRAQYFQGALKTETIYDPKGRPIDAVVKGKRQKWTHIGTKIEIHDEEGKLVKTGVMEIPGQIERWENVEPQPQTFKYNDQGWLIESISGKQSWVYEYNDKGQVLKMIVDQEGAPEGSRKVVLYHYDDKGNLLEEKLEGKTDFIHKYDYLSFDDRGNWTKRTHQVAGLNRTYDEERQLTYFD